VAGGKVRWSVSKTTNSGVADEVAGNKLPTVGALGLAVLDEAGLLALLQEDSDGSSLGGTTP
jgi:DNA ligase (NAD+)